MNSSNQLRQLFWLALAVCSALVLSSCAGTRQQSNSPVSSVTNDQAKSEQAWSPAPVPAMPARSGRPVISKIVVPSVKIRPKASYRSNNLHPQVSMPDFERPVTGVGGGKKSVRIPTPVTTQALGSINPAPLTWTGSDTPFLSTGFDDNATYNGGFVFIPPDSHAAAGPNHVVNVVNATISFHQKDGTLDDRYGLSTFFSSLSPLTSTFDPKVLYDQYENRWVVITMEHTQTPDDPSDTSRMFVAVSDDSDPNGTWYFSEFDTAVTVGVTGYWADYPGFAVDEEAVYITANMFPFSGSSSAHTRLWVLEKGVGSGGLYDSGGTLVVTELDPYGGGGIATTTQPSHMYGTGPTGVGVFLVSYSGLTNDTDEFVQVVRLDDPLGSPTFTQTFISLGNIESLIGGLADMPQPGNPPVTIESNDRRALDAVWRDDYLWLTTTIDPNSGIDSGQATAMWIKIDTSVLSSLTIADSGTIGGEDIATGAYTTFPSVSVNVNEDVVVGFSASAPTVYAGAYFVNREATDSAGVMSGATIVKAGVDKYDRTFGGTRNRWGDYSATVVDPVDGCFWVYNQWADNGATGNDNGRWGTAYAKTCPTVAPPVVCGGSISIPATTWTRFGMPCSVSPGTVAGVFSGLNAANYGSAWVVYEHDASTPVYSLLATTDPLNIGTGYWIYTDTATTVNLTGAVAAINDIVLVGVKPGGRDNYIGYNQNTYIDWNQVQVVDDTTVLSYPDYDNYDGSDYQCDVDPSASDCLMSRVMYKWNGSVYLVYDGVTPGQLGTLDPFDGFWVQAFKPGIKLRIPEGAAAPPASAASVSSVVESAFSTERKKDKKKPKKSSWHIRLIASAGDKQDPGNVLGQLDTATEGNDAHDLEEPAPFGKQHLSILFTNPLFDEVDWGYTTDFRDLTKRPQGVWPFVVKADPGTHEVTLTWEGEDYLFDDTWLVDEYNGAMIKAEPGGSYTFTIETGEHYLRFEVGK
jgi:hypothetical protein